jgi:2-polyprenyl-3-methyl-5-hydroxy-6-metoxy-1,4-benzoquinol methylase
VYIKEKMDDFNMQGAILNDSLNSLSSINKLFGNTPITLKAVKKVLNTDVKRVFHIIDLGCGGGDNLRAIADWCLENNREVQLTGIDGNSHIIEYAKQQVSNIRYIQANILDAEFEIEPCDILISSHFIYRFTDNELAIFTAKSAKKVSTAIIFSELQRSTISYYLFNVVSRLMPFNKMVINDGSNAIKNSFKKEELRCVFDKIKISSYTIKWKWAFRYLITIEV